MTKWPKDNQAARNAFYGDPAKGQIGPQMVPVVPPFAMYYDGKRVKAIQFHRKAADALLAALNEIWDYCEHDQAKIDAAGVSKYAGAYNPRKVRGSATKWSNHAYAAAIDLNAEENGLYAKGNMPQFVIDAFCRQGWMWGGWYSGRKDPMHFEAVDNGGRKPKSAPPVWPKLAVGLLDTGDAPDNAPADEFEDADDKPLNIQPQTATYSLDVEILQGKLEKLGYHEVGDVDGFWGGKTKGALTAFLNDRHSDIVVNGGPTPAINEVVSAALVEGWTRPIADTRATATAKDIAPKVESVRLNLWQRFCAKVAAGGAAVGFTGSSLSSYFDSAQDKLQIVHRAFAKIPPEVWFFIVGIVAALVWYASTRAAQASAKDYNTGRLN